MRNGNSGIISHTVDLEPFFVADATGKLIAIVSNPFTRRVVGAAITATGVAIAMNGDHALADSSDAATDQADTPAEVIVEKGSSIAQELEEQGYSFQERVQDLKNHQIPEELWMTLQTPVGQHWVVSPEVVAMRNERLGISNGGVDLTIHTDGPTFFKQLKDMGLAARTEEIFTNNSRTLAWANTAPDGATIHVDASYLPATAGAPDVLTLPKGSSIIKELIKRRVENPVAAAKQVLAANPKIKPEDMMPGDPFVVPDGILTDEVAPIVPVEPTKFPLDAGEGILDELADRGVANPMSVIYEVLDASGQTPQSAAQMHAGDTVTVPGDIVLQPDIDDAALSVAVTETAQPSAATSEEQAAVTPVNSGVAAPESVLVVGDSLSVGMDKLGNLTEQAASLGYDVTVQAVVGQSLEEGIMAIDYTVAAQQDVVVVELGTNAKESDEKYQETLTFFIDMVNDTAASLGVTPPQFLIVNQYEVGDGDVVRNETRNGINEAVASDYQAQGFNVSVADWDEYAADNPDVYSGSDGVHPTNYTEMSTFVVGAIEETQSAEAAASTPAAPEVTENVDPATKAYETFTNQLAANNGYLTEAAAAEAYNWLIQVSNHPEKSEDFENPEMFIQMPAPTAAMPFVVHPRTCSTELYAKHAGVFSVMLNIATLEYMLQDPQWAKYRDFVIELGDMVSGDHKTHGYGDKGDIRSRSIMSLAAELPDGPLFNIYSPNYDQEFTIQMLVRLGMALAPNGEYLYEHIEFNDDFVIQEVNKRVKELGRNKKLMKAVEGHDEHVHEDPDINNEENDGVIGTPNTTSTCEFIYTNADPALIQAVMEHRAAYPTEAPVAEEAEVVSEQEPPADPVATAEVVVGGPVSPEEIAAAWAMSPEEYIAAYNGGEHYQVEFINGKNHMEVPAYVQQVVDIVWRLEGGVSTETVKQALQVALPESGLDNTSINEGTGDRCLFQINPINDKDVNGISFIDKLNAEHGWNIEYNNLQNDPIGCARVALGLYKMDVGFQYTKEYVDEYIKRFHLKLSDEMYVFLTEKKPTSLGFRAWLPSSKNHGLY